MPPVHQIHPDNLSLATLATLIHTPHQLRLSTASQQRIQRSYQYLHQKLQQPNTPPIYGINTGFGKLCDTHIPDDQLAQLQHNLVVSHACGMGDPVPLPIIRLMLLLKIQSLAYGHSAVQFDTIQRLIYYYNHDILPEIFQQGSLGASGDLAPLAHLALPLLGIGNVHYKGQTIRIEELPKNHQLPPIQLQAKEGLALLNGTQFSLAYAVWNITKAQQLTQIADLNAAIAIDAFQCHLSPFDSRLHRIRPHQGQIHTAAAILEWLDDSEIAQLPKHSVQDPYAFRCTPQVHGATKDALQYISTAIHTEANAVTDNPNVFPDTDAILSGGNFHAQPLALPLDMLAIALAELGSISERRTFQLISGTRQLPPFLSPAPGLNSGYMIPQYTAASIASQNKQLATPASIDSIVSSNGQEDHVSMAANAATKAYRVVQNLERILAIEFMTAAQALHLRRPHQSSPKIEAILQKYSTLVPPLQDDRYLRKDIITTKQFLRTLFVSTSQSA